MALSYMTHQDLPRPALFKSIQKPHNELQEQLQGFLDAHSGCSRFTIDDDNVGRGLVCAAVAASDIKGIMLYSMKQEIQDYMEKQGFQCLDNGGVIQCTKSRLKAKL